MFWLSLEYPSEAERLVKIHRLFVKVVGCDPTMSSDTGKVYAIDWAFKTLKERDAAAMILKDYVTDTVKVRTFDSWRDAIPVKV